MGEFAFRTDEWPFLGLRRFPGRGGSLASGIAATFSSFSRDESATLKLRCFARRPVRVVSECMDDGRRWLTGAVLLPCDAFPPFSAAHEKTTKQQRDQCDIT